MAKYAMTVAELRKLHADETIGGFDYCIMSDVRKDDDLCIVDIEAKTPPTASKTVVAITALNTKAEAAKCKLTSADVTRLGLAAKVVVKPIDDGPITDVPITITK